MLAFNVWLGMYLMARCVYVIMLRLLRADMCKSTKLLDGQSKTEDEEAERGDVEKRGSEEPLGEKEEQEEEQEEESEEEKEEESKEESKEEPEEESKEEQEEKSIEPEEPEEESEEEKEEEIEEEALGEGKSFNVSDVTYAFDFRSGGVPATDGETFHWLRAPAGPYTDCSSNGVLRITPPDCVTSVSIQMEVKEWSSFNFHFARTQTRYGFGNFFESETIE